MNETQVSAVLTRVGILARCYRAHTIQVSPMSLSFRPEYTNQYGRGRGRGIVQYGMGGYYVAYNSFLSTNIPTTAVPSENNEFEVAA